MGVGSSSRNISADGSGATSPITRIGLADSALLPKPLAWNPPDEEWVEFINGKMWWARGFTGEIPKDKLPMLPLRDALLRFGGNEVVLPGFEQDLNLIMDRGELRYGDGAELRVGNPSSCHQNSALLFEDDPENLRIGTGYALSDDGAWRQHSWVFKRDGGIIETTVPRVAYFGVQLNQGASEGFAYENL